MAIATIPEAIARGYLSASYAGNDNSKGALFSPRIAAPGSIVTITMVTQALDWGNAGGAQTDADLREMANYLIWLIGMYGQQAQARIDSTSGGGSVVPGGTVFNFPLRLTGSDFEPDGITYVNSNIVGFNLMLFVSNYNEEWQFSPAFFDYTPTGFVITEAGFNANNFNQIIVDRYFNP